jgi:hypothetical protein
MTLAIGVETTRLVVAVEAAVDRRQAGAAARPQHTVVTRQGEAVLAHVFARLLGAEPEHGRDTSPLLASSAGETGFGGQLSPFRQA